MEASILTYSIVAEGLTKKFGDFVAVDNISFSVQKGEFFGLLGPNGAGKTTTIRMLTGVLKPESGRILIDGIDLKKEPLIAKERMGVIPEVGTVYIDLTARENLELFGRYYGLAKNVREERADQMLKDLSLHDRADEVIKGFSKGMKQRISIGCAMVHEPSVLFLDEPTEGLDVQSRRLIVDKVKTLNAKGCTVILTTHNIEDASRLCQRVCIINKGKIVTVDSPEHLKSTFEKTQSIEVSFDRKVDCAFFSTQCITRLEEHADKIRIYTSNVGEAIDKIMAVKEEQGLNIVSLTTLGPSLEDVFRQIDGGQEMRYSIVMRGATVTARKDIRIYYRKAPVFIFGLILPTFLFFAFFVGRQLDISRYFPGFLAMTIFFTASSVGPLIIPWEKQSEYLRASAHTSGEHSDARSR